MRDFVKFQSNQKEVFESNLIALFINVPAINIVIASMIPAFSNGVMAILYLVLICLFLIDSFLHYLNRLHIESVASAMIMFVIIIAYSFTWVRIGNQLPVYNLIIYVFLPLLVISKMDINGALVIKSCILIPALGTPFIPIVFQQNNNWISMGLSYAFLPAVVFASAYLLTCPKKRKIITVASLCDLIYLVLIFLYGSRGVVLSGLMATFLFWLVRKRIQHVKDPYFVIRIICVSIVAILIIMFRWQIVYSLYDFFKGKGITVEFFDKLIRLQKLGDIDNGRSDINRIFYAEFMKKPLLGHGIKSFQYYTGIVYPHNFVYQMLFDIGAIGTLIIILPLFLSTIRFVRGIGYYENSTLLIALICASVPGALLSGDLWLNPLLWLTFSLILRQAYRR